MSKTVFVTVGTTSFDKLIATLCTASICEVLSNQGYHKLVIQIGQGTFEPKLPKDTSLQLEWFRFKNSISEDINKCELILSHAGSGSILECLKAKKKLVVVVNETLMDNHQIELAEALQKEDYLLFCTPKDLKETLIQRNEVTSRICPPTDHDLFPLFLDRLMGFNF